MQQQSSPAVGAGAVPRVAKPRTGAVEVLALAGEDGEPRDVGSELLGRQVQLFSEQLELLRVHVEASELRVLFLLLL